MNVEILAVLTGTIAPIAGGRKSAIVKTPRDMPVAVGLLGLEDDQQANRKYHGGPDKALHQYPFDHYDYWRGHLPDPARLTGLGCFGENIATVGMTEDSVCVGDRFRLGTALIEISQGREPCSVQAQHLGWAGLVKAITQQRKCGWYFRVIETGKVAAGDPMTLVDRPLPDWTVQRVFGLLFGGDHRQDAAALPVLADMACLFDGWRQRARDLQA